MHSGNPSQIERPSTELDFTSAHVPVIDYPVATGRPLGLTVISVLSLLGGIVGVLMGLLAIVQVLFAAQLATAFTPQVEGGMMEIQREMQLELSQVTGQFAIPNSILAVAGIIVSGGLGLSGFGLLQGRAWARRLFSKIMIAAMAMEVFKSVLSIVIQTKTYPVISRSMDRMSEQAGGGSSMVSEFMLVGMIVSLVLWIGWSVAKVGAMAWARWYVRQEKLDPYFAGTSSPEDTTPT